MVYNVKSAEIFSICRTKNKISNFNNIKLEFIVEFYPFFNFFCAEI